MYCNIFIILNKDIKNIKKKMYQSEYFLNAV